MVAVTVDVTQNDIAHGRRGLCRECPAALAMERAGIVEPRVRNTELWLRTAHEHRLVKVRLPESAAKFIDDFDANRTVEPFSFQIDIPDQFYRPNGLFEGTV
jgi:hypothetical protein